MVVDTSALLAILLAESDASRYAESIEAAAAPVISAATRIELDIVVVNKLGAEALESLDALLEVGGIAVEPVTPAQSMLARDAYLQFGKGRGHPAQLNFGDCFAYALAKELQRPLLFKGTDFSETDIAPAIYSPG